LMFVTKPIILGWVLLVDKLQCRGLSQGCASAWLGRASRGRGRATSVLLDFEAGILLAKSTAVLSLESDDEMNVKPGLAYSLCC
jgi:hypothetical protein